MSNEKPRRCGALDSRSSVLSSAARRASCRARAPQSPKVSAARHTILSRRKRVPCRHRNNVMIWATGRRRAHPRRPFGSREAIVRPGPPHPWALAANGLPALLLAPQVTLSPSRGPHPSSSIALPHVRTKQGAVWRCLAILQFEHAPALIHSANGPPIGRGATARRHCTNSVSTGWRPC